MKTLGLLILCLGLAVVQFVPAEEVPPGPSCYRIPSNEDISSNEVMSSYRKQYCPKQYVPESSVWIGVDIGMLAAILLAGCVMVWRNVHFSRLWIPGGISLFYFGFIRGGCICPVGAVANMTIGLRHPEMIGVSTAIMFLLPLVVAFIMGRVFCVAGCPLGAVQHLLGGRRWLKIPSIPHIILRGFPVVALVATVWLALRGTCFLVCLLDPYKPLFFFGFGTLQRFVHMLQGGLVEPGILWIGDLVAWGIFTVAVGLGLWVYRPFCRFVCPYGVLLGLFSMVALKRRRIEQSQCVQCGICEKNCPVHAIVRDPVTLDFEVAAYHCIQCNRCSSFCHKRGIG
jgi:polyferredoxin